MSLFRKRTADQIITDKLSTGCTDTALVFISITRAKGIPTKYVEVFSKKWLEKGGDILAGHVYAECFINDKWMQIDPHLCRIHPLIDYHNYEIYEKGLDSWDLGIDSFEEMKKSLEKEADLDLLFLTAEEPILIQRYGTTRRRHPALLHGESWDKAVSREKKWLIPLRESASVFIDTTNYSPKQLASFLEERYKNEVLPRLLNVSLISFGFKYGLCQGVDSVFDVRFLRNPFFDPVLKRKDGTQEEVQKYVFSDPNFEPYIEKIVALHEWLLPRYYEEGKHYFRIGIGCTGGRHRSVSVVEELVRRFAAKKISQITFTAHHRDLGIDPDK